MRNDTKQLHDRMFREISRDGCQASPELLQRAFLNWLDGERLEGYSTLAARMNRLHPRNDVDHAYARVADALVQKLRKAGLITRVKTNWKLTEAGQAFRNEILEDMR